MWLGDFLYLKTNTVMKVMNEILGNIHQPQWANRLKGMTVENVNVNLHAPRASHFVVKNAEYAVSLKHHPEVADGDIVSFEPDKRRVMVLRLSS